MGEKFRESDQGPKMTILAVFWDIKSTNFT